MEFDGMKFELGKCYEHTTGKQMKIVGVADTTLYGLGFVGETPEGTYSIVGTSKENAINFVEISNEKWMQNFSKDLW